MLAKITSKNQVTIPKKIMDQIPETRYFEVELQDELWSSSRSGPIRPAWRRSDPKSKTSISAHSASKKLLNGHAQVIRVVLDTNVLVSGLLFGGTPGKLLDLWRTGTIRLTMSRVMLDEFLRVLAYPSFACRRKKFTTCCMLKCCPMWKW